jgi:hypothetical protein
VISHAEPSSSQRRHARIRSIRASSRRASAASPIARASESVGWYDGRSLIAFASTSLFLLVLSVFTFVQLLRRFVTFLGRVVRPCAVVSSRHSASLCLEFEKLTTGRGFQARAIGLKGPSLEKRSGQRRGDRSSAMNWRLEGCTVDRIIHPFARDD